MRANYTFVCFGCRNAARRAFAERTAVHCPQCRKAMTFVGSRARIPPKDRPREWTAFEAEFNRRMSAKEASFRDGRLFWVKALETQIRKLEERPPNAGRQKAIVNLKKNLTRLTAFLAR